MLSTIIAIGIIVYLKIDTQFYNQAVFQIVLIACVIISLMFYQLKLIVSDNTLRIIYGIGIIQFKKKLEHVESVEVIKTSWYYGLGIRITTEGMLYNIQGLKAVRITRNRNEKKKSFMVGSPEPKKLKEALEG